MCCTNKKAGDSRFFVLNFVLLTCNPCSPLCSWSFWTWLRSAWFHRSGSRWAAFLWIACLWKLILPFFVLLFVGFRLLMIVWRKMCVLIPCHKRNLWYNQICIAHAFARGAGSGIWSTSATVGMRS